MAKNQSESSNSHRRQPRTTQKRSLETFQRVLDATIDVIESQGVQAVRVSEISRSTGVAYGSVYHHFGDRDGLIRSAQLERLRRQPGVDISAFRDALRADDTINGFLGALVDICRNIASPQRRSIRLLRAGLLDTSQHDITLAHEIRSMETEVMTELVEVLDIAKDRGIADPALDSLALAAYLSAVSFGLVLLEANEYQPDADALAEVILRGFTAFMPARP